MLNISILLKLMKRALMILGSFIWSKIGIPKFRKHCIQFCQQFEVMENKRMFRVDRFNEKKIILTKISFLRSVFLVLENWC